MKYNEEDLKKICDLYAGSGMFPTGKGEELLFYAMYGRESNQNSRKVFSAVIGEYLYQHLEGGVTIPPLPFDKNTIERKINCEKRRQKRKFSVLFGVATVDGYEYLPKRIHIGKLIFSRVRWGSIEKLLKKYGKTNEYYNDFLRNASFVDMIHIDDQSRADISSERLYQRIEWLAAKNVYYKVSLYAYDNEEATDIVENYFKGVLSAAASMYVLSFQDVTWSRSGVIKRRAPAMFNGVFLALDCSNNVLSLLELDEKILLADQKLLHSKEKSETIIKRYKSIVRHICKDDLNPVERKLALVSNLLYDSLSSRNVANRHLGLWQVIESGMGWNDCREKDIIGSLKSFHDVDNPNNIIWLAIGDYILDKRGLYVHGGKTLSRDNFGSYDTSLNFYHDYIRAELKILLFLLKGRPVIRSDADYNLFMKTYGLKKDDLRIAKWIADNRKYQ